MSNWEAGNKPVTGIGYSNRVRLQSSTQCSVHAYQSSLHVSSLMEAYRYGNAWMRAVKYFQETILPGESQGILKENLRKTKNTYEKLKNN